jgi:hypothetical protein
LTTPGAFSNAGQLAIGPGGTVDGDGAFSQPPSTALDFILGETTPLLARTLMVGGEFTLGGTLDVSLSNGFTLAPGETFTLIDFPPGDLNGGFASVVLPNVPGLTIFRSRAARRVGTARRERSGTLVLAGLADGTARRLARASAEEQGVEAPRRGRLPVLNAIRV